MGGNHSLPGVEKLTGPDAKNILGDMISDHDAHLLDRSTALEVKLHRTSAEVNRTKERLLETEKPTRKDLDYYATKHREALALEIELSKVEKQLDVAKEAASARLNGRGHSNTDGEVAGGQVANGFDEKIKEDLLEAFLNPFTEKSTETFSKLCKALKWECYVHGGACGPRDSICALEQAAIEEKAKPKGIHWKNRDKDKDKSK